jgi:hypothetical protein
VQGGRAPDVTLGSVRGACARTHLLRFPRLQHAVLLLGCERRAGRDELLDLRLVLRVAESGARLLVRLRAEA